MKRKLNELLRLYIRIKRQKSRLGATFYSLLYIAVDVGLTRLELLRNDQIINNKKT